MIIIELQSVPNQSFSFENGDDRWLVDVKTAFESMVCNITLNEEVLIQGVRIMAGQPIIPYPHLATHGNFGIMTENNEPPHWTKFNTNQQLVFWHE